MSNFRYLKELHLVSSRVFGVSGIPCHVDEVVCVCPVREQVAGFHIVHSDVHIIKGLREKVVNLPRHVQNIAHTEKHTETTLEPHW